MINLWTQDLPLINRCSSFTRVAIKVIVVTMQTRMASVVSRSSAVISETGNRIEQNRIIPIQQISNYLLLIGGRMTRREFVVFGEYLDLRNIKRFICNYFLIFNIYLQTQLSKQLLPTAALLVSYQFNSKIFLMSRTF